jgi:hypothetical protein
MNAYTDLRDTLANLYLDRESAHRIVTDANIRPELVTYSDKAIDNWSNIIQEANKQGLLIPLLEVVLREYPRNLLLKEALSELKEEVSSDGRHKGGVNITLSVRSQSSRSRPPPGPEDDLVMQQNATNEILHKIHDKIGYSWMFVLLRKNVISQGLEQDVSKLDQWLEKVRSFPRDQASKYEWQLLCMDKHIQLIGIPDMANKLISSFSKTLSLREPDAPRFFRFAAKHIEDRVESIALGLEVLTKKQNLSKCANKLYRTITELEELETELAIIKSTLEMYNCLINEDGVRLPQNKIDYCLIELKSHMKKSISKLKPDGTPITSRIETSTRLKQLKEQSPEYKNWLLAMANKIESTRKYVFSLN